ncbi:MAG: universal stress protein [Cyclobacteriaceae bacterium]|nr:universal stress protein [Cyclobacteriaceae bacterium]MDH4298191.1 universal stress protein [Cyclobacteriaceae bacterium]MDH5250375.1 universal stress protein [Cyclobacteriaceae bacterium]
MKNILVPCDFSAPSREAFKFAINIAAKTKGEIVVLYAIQIPVMYDFGGGTPLAVNPISLASMEEDAKKLFQKMNHELQANTVKTSLEILQLDLISAIKRLIDTKKTDIVVMGTAGTSGFQEMLIGSNTEKVVRHSPVPVLAVRTAPALDSIKRILLPTTLKLDQTAFIGKVKELQEFFNASLQILLVNTPSHFMPDAEANEALAEFVKYYKLKNYTLHFRNYRNEEDGIVKFAHEEKSDLIAMATHARKGLAHIFNGSITEDVVNHLTCPVWTYSRGK